MAVDYASLGSLGALSAFFAAFLIAAIIIAIALYVYFALVLSTLAKKLKHGDIAWLAWIPIANLALFPILADKEWPWVFIFLVPIVNIVFMIIWTWAIFEKRKYPGWLSLVFIGGIIPFIGFIFSLASLVIWGVVAWRDN
ncbi:TPA: hypothetical protein HA235_06270 [Candidatus Woesearchaeota archaeon]|nr:hypothetical protein [uncultured archaeon]MBS3173741.1 hypothetical protein [Candidatus Woesearchaeota archaeon]AQS33725.1 hypothetical protein [uncultured archaeon]HIH32285.1 hypothetical protein [Candidatus Woesearchaeota archaeon]HIH54560.1 hypothetical protein [Candidatus Woesearchaeota archaeon]